MSNKKRLFIDMDGTLAEYRTFVSMEQYFQPEYFKSLKPLTNVVEAIKLFIKNNPNVDVYILSACPEGPTAPKEKNDWLDTHLPQIPLKNRIYTLIGQNKKDFIPGGIGKNDFLLDDYPHNLHDWCKLGSGIKLFNGLNANSEKWVGSCLSYKSSPEHISKSLKDILLKDKAIIDSMDEIQIKNEERGQSLFINRDELAEILKKHFSKEYKDIDDFRRNYTSSDWDFIKRISPNAKIETHTSWKQYEFEGNTLKKKIDNTLAMIVESFNNQRKDLVEKEMKLYLLGDKAVYQPEIVFSLQENFNVWYDYFNKSITDLKKTAEAFFARYEAASKTAEIFQHSLVNDKKNIFVNIDKVKKVCETTYFSDKEKISFLSQKVKSLRNNQLVSPSKSVGDEILDAKTEHQFSTNNLSLSDIELY